MEAGLAVQIAITTALAAVGDLGAPVSDEVAENAPYPFVRTGDDQVVPDPADCLDRSVTVHSTLHVFSQRFGRREARTIAGAIVDALDHSSLDLGSDWALVEIAHAGTRIIDDPDGSAHAVVTFTSLLDPA